MTNPRDREVVRNTVVRENEGSTGGLVLGIVLASLIGLGAALFFMNQRPATQAPSTNTTIIEKTKEAAPQPKAPDIKINMPNPAPVQVPNVNVTIPSPAAPAPAAPQQAAPPAEAPAPATP